MPWNVRVAGPEPETISSRLARLIEERGITQIDLAAAVELEQSDISSFVNRRRIPGGVIREALASYFGEDPTTWHLLAVDEEIRREKAKKEKAPPVATGPTIVIEAGHITDQNDPEFREVKRAVEDLLKRMSLKQE
jgi:transcriptional regulator with XRE-family HTH domain